MIPVLLTLVCLALMATGGLGALVYIAQRELKASRLHHTSGANELKTTLEGVNRVHNELAQKVITLEDRMSAIDMKVGAARSGAKGAWSPGVGT